MRVPQYQENQRFGSAPDGRFSVNGRALDLAGGREAWNEVVRAGAVLSRTGARLFDIGLDQTREHNRTVALERTTELEKRLRVLQQEQAQRQGQNALGSEDGKVGGVCETMRASLDKLRSELTEGLNDSQKELFDQVYERRSRWADGWAGQHEAQQRRVWQNTVEDGSLAEQARRALSGIGNPEELFAARGNIEEVMRLKGQREGWDETFTRAQTEAFLTKNVYAPALDAAIESDDPRAANDLLKRFGAGPDGDLAVKYRAKIKNAAARLEAKARAEAERARTRAEKAAVSGSIAEILDGVRTFPTLEEQREAAFAGADKIADPDVRDKVRTGIKQEMSWRKVRQEAATVREVRHYQELARNQKWTPRQASEQIEKADISEFAKEKLRADYDGRAERATIRNKTALARLRGLLDLGPERGGMDGRDADAIDAYIARNGLTYEQGQKAHAYAGQGGAPGTLTQTQLNRAFKSLFPQKNMSSMPGDLFDLVASELEPGKPVTNGQVRRIVSKLYMEREADGPGWFSDSRPHADPGIPEEERAGIENILRENGVTPTPDRIRRYWREQRRDEK